MPMISFSMFKSKILAGLKTQTIRSPRKYPIKKGDYLSLWWKVRTQEGYKFGDSTCTKITPVLIYEDHVEIKTPMCTAYPSTNIWQPSTLELFATDDGFESWQEMLGYFRPRLGEPLEIIKWQYPFTD